MTVFGDKAFIEVMKIKWGHKVSSNSIGLVFSEEEETSELSLSMCTQIKGSTRAQKDGGWVAFREFFQERQSIEKEIWEVVPKVTEVI